MSISYSNKTITSGQSDVVATTGFGDPVLLINLGPGTLYTGGYKADASTGTSQFQNGVNTVAGTGTNYSAWVKVGDMVRASSTQPFAKVLTVNSDILLTLTAVYAGANHSGRLFAVCSDVNGFEVTVSPTVNSRMPLNEYEGEIWCYADGGNCDVRILENIPG